MPLTRGLLVPIALILAAQSRVPAAERSPAEAEAVANRVLARAIIVDTHADTPQMMLDADYDLADPDSPYMVSIPKMQAGHLGAEFFSIWVSTNLPSREYVPRALQQIDVVREQVERHADALGFATSADDIVRLHRQNKIAILMGLEGGHMIRDNLRVLSAFHRLGVRYMTLTHTAHTPWADSSNGKPRWNGLTDYGRRVVAQMNRLGMMVDISHVSDKTFYDVLASSRAPVIASHSSCRALCNAPRNMTDEMIHALAENGGVIQINFYPAFLDEAYRDAHSKLAKQEEAAVKVARDRARRAGKQLSWIEEVKVRRQVQSDLPMPSLTRIADHIDHAVRVGGVDHVGLGSDFDGIESAPQGIEDVSKLPALVGELARRGYSEEDLTKILGGNLLRVMRRVEQVALQIQETR